MSAEQQTERLARYLMENTDEPSEDGGAGDAAIRLNGSPRKTTRGASVRRYTAMR